MKKLFLILYILIISNSLSIISKEYKNLINWIRENNGYISTKVMPIETNKNNRIIKSTEKIKFDEIIAFIPESIIVSSLHKLINPLCRKAYGLDHEQFLDCIALYLTIDRDNPNSFFRPFYDYLPYIDIKSFPPEFSAEKQNLYKELGFDLYISIHEQKLKRAYNEFVEKILPEKKIEKKYDKFKYNFYLAKTRNFSRIKSELLSDINSCVPFIDLLNHDNNYNMDFEYSDDKKGFILKAVKDIDKDIELTVSYGDENNINLLIIYGFTLKNNKFKCPIRIELDGIKYNLYPSDDNNDINKDILYKIKILKERYAINKKDDNFFIIELLLNGCKEKLEKIKLIQSDDFNINNIKEEEKISLYKYIHLLENNYLNKNNSK